MAEIAQTHLRKFTDEIWRDEITPTLVEYIRIPNKSPSFAPDWRELGHMDKAVELLVAWAKPKVAALGASLSVERLPGRTPLILIDAPGAKNDDTVLLYGHLDKQPEMTGWTEGKGPWIPVLEGDKLYGRGGADDGYALFGVAGGALGAEEPKHPACAGGHCDRGVGRIRLAGFAVLHGGARRSHRFAVAGCVPGQRLRRLRAALAYDVAARPCRRCAARRGAERRRAFGRRFRHRAFKLPDPAAIAGAAGEHRDRRSHRQGIARRHSRRAHRPGQGRRESAGRSGLCEISVREGHAPGGR